MNRFKQLPFKTLSSLKSMRNELVFTLARPTRRFGFNFRSGDGDAFTRAYRKFRVPIFNFINQRLDDPGTAEELTQEVFLKAYRFRDSYDGRHRFSTWLWTIAKNTLSDWYRKRGPMLLSSAPADSERSVDVDSLPSRALDPERTAIEAVERGEIQALMAREIAKLSELQKKALLLRMIKGLSYHEIGERLNLSLSAVKGLIHRAKTTLGRPFEMARALEQATLENVRVFETKGLS